MTTRPPTAVRTGARRPRRACAGRVGVAACRPGHRYSCGCRFGWHSHRDSGTSTTTSSTTTTTTTTTTTCRTHPPRHLGHERPSVTAAGIAGNGSSFASPAVTNWTDQVGQAPYNISVNYTPSTSGQGRYEFTNGTVDYAVSDTGYVNSSVGTTPPSFAFEFIPITAAGVAFMYNIPGLTQTLQLTSYTACLLLTGQIKNWDDPALKQNGANASVTMPNLPVMPVTESDPAGTNFVLEEYCIDEQPAVWANTPRTWPGCPPPSGVPYQPRPPGRTGRRRAMATTSSRHRRWHPTSSTAPVPSEPCRRTTPPIRGSRGQTRPRRSQQCRTRAASSPCRRPSTWPLRWPMPRSSPTARTNSISTGSGPNVYNPSTYSYLLTPTKGWASAKGDTMSQFVNYVLTLGSRRHRNSVTPAWDFPSSAMASTRSSPMFPARSIRPRPKALPIPAVTSRRQRSGGSDDPHLRRDQRSGSSATPGGGEHRHDERQPPRPASAGATAAANAQGEVTGSGAQGASDTSAVSTRGRARLDLGHGITGIIRYRSSSSACCSSRRMDRSSSAAMRTAESGEHLIGDPPFGAYGAARRGPAVASLPRAVPPSPAGADTDPTALVGEGGSFLTPVTDLLLKADPGLAPLNPQYDDANLDDAISDFVGTRRQLSARTSWCRNGRSPRPRRRPQRPTVDRSPTCRSPRRRWPWRRWPCAIRRPRRELDRRALPGHPADRATGGVALHLTLTSPAVSPNQGLPASLTGWGDPRLTQADGQPIPRRWHLPGINPGTVGGEHRSDGVLGQ